MKHIYLASLTALLLGATTITAACGDDDASSTATTGSTGSNGGGAGGSGGQATGGAGGVGGTAPAATCGNVVTEVGEVCFNGIAPVTAAGVSGLIDLEVTDCDQDGDLDLLMLGSTPSITPQLSVLLNKGDGVFTQGPTLMLVSSGVVGMAFDPTSSYRARVPVVGGNTLNIVAIGSDCSLSLAESKTLPGPVQAGVAAVNLDKSAPSNYLMFVDVNGPNELYWYTGADNVVNQYGPVPNLDVVSAVSSGVIQPGAAAAIFANAQGKRGELFFTSSVNVPSPAGSVPTIGTTSAGVVDMILTDLDANGYGDVATANQSASTIGVMFSDSASIAATYPDISITGTGPTKGYNPIDIAAGDIDGDGDIDIITANEGDVSQGAPPSLTLLLNDGSGKFTIAVASDSTTAPVQTGFPMALDAKADEVHLVDLNGDNALDMVFLSGDGDVAVMLAKP